MQKQSAEELMLLGMISQLEPEQKEKIESICHQLDTLLAETGDEGLIALSLVSLQKANGM